MGKKYGVASVMMKAEKGSPDHPESSGRTRHPKPNPMELVESQPGDGGSTSLRKSGLPRLDQASSSQARRARPPSKHPQKPAEETDSLEQPLDLFVPPPPVIIETEHAGRRKATAAAWAELLPKLVYPLMEWLHYHREGETQTSALCSCPQREKEVRIISFTTISKVKISYCQHQPPAVSLIKLGAFSSTPVRPPAWAFDIMLLEYMSKQFAYGTPDISAWCNATASFLSSVGVEKVPTPGALHRPVQSALLHYELTRDRIGHLTVNVIQAFIPPSPPSTKRGEGPGSNQIPGVMPTLTPTSMTTPTPTPVPTCTPMPKPKPGLSPAPVIPPSPVLDEKGAITKAIIEELSKKGLWVCHCPRPEDHEPTDTSPSLYLQMACPLCYPGYIPIVYRGGSFHSVGSLDGNFENIRLRHAGSGDQPIPKGHTFFLTPEEILQAQREVDQLRKPDAKPDGTAMEDDTVLPGLSLPNYIYNGCNTRFLAAGEQNKKTKASIFSDTGLMALVCRHDRPLFLVNLKDQGERQYNAIALVNRLFKELPPSWRVGLLYDIGCQIHRSIVKYKLLAAYADRITWAVSIFHAFGHDFPCQAIYHPHKCQGFGFSDGEGCERVWASLQKLISGLRVSGYHRRLYVLDQQLAHLNRVGLLQLGKWWRKKNESLQRKRNLASAAVSASNMSQLGLRLQWNQQRHDVTRKAPSASKAMATQFANKIVSMMDSREKALSLITRMTENLAESSNSGEETDAALLLDDLHIAVTRLEARIKKTTEVLTGKDPGTARSIKAAVQNEYLAKRLKARAVLMRVHQKVKHSLLAAVPYRRRISRAKKDVRIRKHTEDSIARRVPGIRQLARRYNVLCDELKSGGGRQVRLSALPPAPLDLDQLFNPEANQHMWTGQGLDNDDDNDREPPEYLSNDNVREGIPALLVLDRAKEEEIRLQAEGSAMITWVDTQLKKTQMALLACTDAPFHHQLELHEKRLVQLGQQWQNETEAFLEGASWPKALGLKKASQCDDDDDDDDDWGSISDLDDFGPVPDSVLQVDDRHVSFLEEGEAADDDEVERIVALVDHTELAM